MSDRKDPADGFRQHLDQLDGLLSQMGGQIAEGYELRMRRRATLTRAVIAVIAISSGGVLFSLARSPNSESASGPEIEIGLSDSVGVAVGVTECPGGDLARGPLVPGGMTPDVQVVPAFTDPPQLLNRGDLIRAIDQEYPPDLRDAGERGTSLVYFLVNAVGVAEDILLAESSGFDAFDQAALRIASSFEFSPAVDGDEPVEAWVQVPITFSPAQTRCDLCSRIPPPEPLVRSC